MLCSTVNYAITINQFIDYEACENEVGLLTLLVSFFKTALTRIERNLVLCNPMTRKIEYMIMISLTLLFI